MAETENTDGSDRRISESALGLGLDSIPDAVLVADSETGRIVDANTTAGELFHCQPTDLVGHYRSELHPSEFEDAYIEAFQRAVDGQRVNRLRNGRPVYIETLDGERTPVEINARRLDTSDGVFILGVFREVTDQLERERRLEATTARLETLLDALPLPVVVLDTDGVVERWNRAAETTFGYPTDSVVGKQYPLFIEDDEFERLFERILNGGILDGYETTHRTQEGSRLPVELHARPLYENGSFSGVAGAAIDLSDRQQREQQLDVLHRVLRHNLRNELTVINGWTQQLAAGTDPMEASEKIRGASERLLALAEEAKHIRTGLAGDTHRPDSVPVGEALSRLSEQATEQGTASMRIVTSPESGAICTRGLAALSQLLDSVLNYVGEATLEVAAATHDRQVVVEFTAPEPVLPTGPRLFLTSGEETALKHGSDLAVPRAYLMIQSIGGEVTTDAETADTLSVELPRMDGSRA